MYSLDKDIKNNKSSPLRASKIHKVKETKTAWVHLHFAFVNILQLNKNMCQLVKDCWSTFFYSILRTSMLITSHRIQITGHFGHKKQVPGSHNDDSETLCECVSVCVCVRESLLWEGVIRSVVEAGV